MVDLTFAAPTCEDFFSCMKYTFDLTDTGQGGVTGIIILLIIGVTLFLSMKGFGVKTAMGTAGLSIGILAILARTMSWINDKALTLFIIIGVAGLWLLLKGQSQYDS